MRNASTQLLDKLQAEFCPPQGPLDSCLLAALFADLPNKPSLEDERLLLESLKQLADHASTQISSTENDPGDLDLGITESTQDSSLRWGDESAATSDMTSGSSAGHYISYPVDIPIGFLKAAFPDIPTGRLQEALNGESEDDPDMEVVIEKILSAEYFRDLDERGGEDLPPKNEWSIVQRKAANKRVVGSKPRPRPKPIPLVDIRQQHHISPQPSSVSISALQYDPWTQVSSICFHLSTLLPTREPGFYSSFFHKPEYARDLTGAIRAALKVIVSSNRDQVGIEKPSRDTLFTLLDFILSSPQYSPTSSHLPPKLVEDAELALEATCGKEEAAFDLVNLIGELDGHEQVDVESRIWQSNEVSVMVSPTTPTSPFVGRKSASLASSSSNSFSLLSSTPVIPPSSRRKKGNSKKVEDEWTEIPVRKPMPNKNPHAAYIPARAASSGSFKPAVGAPLSSRKTIRMDALHRRNELLIEAGRAWKRRGTDAYGTFGQVALFLAERARAAQEVARKEALEIARDMVETKRLKSEDQMTLDLHGTSMLEAIDIVKGVLLRVETSPSSPLKIITGRGAHSANGISVLKPAVRSALVADRWTVTEWDAGLVVRGKLQ